jgi:hypothetical protein
MSKRFVVVLAFLWIASLVGVATVVAQVLAQPVPPKVLTGSDLGFRVEGIDHTGSGSAVGRLVINVNGKWVEARIGGFGTTPAP